MTKCVRIFLFLSAIVFWRCSDDDSKPFKPGSQPKLNIAGASGIVVYDQESNGGGRIATQGTNLFKITAEGDVENVKFVDENGQDITGDESNVRIDVRKLYKAGDDFFVLDGEFIAWDTLGNYQQYFNLLVRKADGAIFEIRNPDFYGSNILDIYSFGGLLQEMNFQSDKNGNLYYVNPQTKLMRINVSDPARLSMIEYLPAGQNTYYFIIDKDGNCIYSPESFYRLRKKTGGIFDFQTSALSDAQEFWIGSNGKIYFKSYDWENEVPTIGILDVDDGGEVTWDIVWVSPGFGQHSSVLNTNHNYYYKIQKPNSVVFVAFQNGSHWEFSENDNQVINFELPSLSSNTKIVSSDEFYYITSGTNLYKVSLEGHSYQSILSQGEYEVYTMSVDNDEILQISALRFSDGKKIIAEINAGNEFTLIDEEQDKEVLYLQRLN